MKKLIKQKDLDMKVSKANELNRQLKQLERFEETKKMCWNKLFMWRPGKHKEKDDEIGLRFRSAHGIEGMEFRVSKRLEKAVSKAIVEEKQLLIKEIMELMKED